LHTCYDTLIFKKVDVKGTVHADGRTEEKPHVHRPQHFQPEGELAMKKRRVFFLVLVLIATFVACASASDAEKVGDMALAENVKSVLEADDSLRSFNIGIKTRDGVVILSGWVSSQDALVKAGQIARSVKGTRSVENNLIVK
jgi:hypothetical protein